MSGIPGAEDIRDARDVLRAHLPVTRLVPADALSQRLGGAVALKLESELPTGSFKPRGAIYALARRLRHGAVREVVTASTGNHGAAVAYAGRILGVPVTVFLPEHPNPVKRSRIADLGARIVETGRDLDDAIGAAKARALERGAYLLSDATDPALPAGPATIGCEIAEQWPATREIIVPMGDTALIRGLASAARELLPGVRIVGVQAAGAPAYYLSWKAGRPIVPDICDTIADGLATRTPETVNVTAIRRLVDEVVLVTDGQMVDAMRLLLHEEHVPSEPAGAAATAAALARGTVAGPTVLLVTGANMAPEMVDLVAGS